MQSLYWLLGKRKKENFVALTMTSFVNENWNLLVLLYITARHGAIKSCFDVHYCDLAEKTNCWNDSSSIWATKSFGTKEGFREEIHFEIKSRWGRSDWDHDEVDKVLSDDARRGDLDYWDWIEGSTAPGKLRKLLRKTWNTFEVKSWNWLSTIQNQIFIKILMSFKIYFLIVNKFRPWHTKTNYYPTRVLSMWAE